MQDTLDVKIILFWISIWESTEIGVAANTGDQKAGNIGDANW
jgi:hypothetical protein